MTTVDRLLVGAVPTIGKPPVERGYYSVSDVATMLDVNRVSVWGWIRSGKLSASRVGRTTRIQRQDLERAMMRINVDGVLRNSGHVVQFYEQDAYLLDDVCQFIGNALHSGETGIVVATPARREAIDRWMQASGLDLAEVRGSGRYLSLDASETLGRFMEDGVPNPERFVEVVGGIVAGSTEAGHPVSIFGEIVALLAIEGNPTGAIRLERLWNALQERHSFSLFCAYPMSPLGDSRLSDAMSAICEEHSAVFPTEGYVQLPSTDDRMREVTRLQQKARSLEAEVDRRRDAEDRLEAALSAEQSARGTAEDALRVRDEFIAVAAHELRTPIASLLGFTQLLQRRCSQGRLEPERISPMLQTIAGEADKLSRMISQLLDLSRLESGRLTLELVPVDLETLVEKTVSAASNWSGSHSMLLHSVAPMQVRVDPLRFEEVLINLLDNAIKYSPEGGSIEIDLSPCGVNAAEISVRDWGIGIPLERRSMIFERFYQAHEELHRPGMGLGLYVSRQIVELHGGDIRAEFPDDGGTRFVVLLPTTNLAP